MILPKHYQNALDAHVSRLTHLLGENLYSCVLYGSAVRGNIVPGVSDINILIILQESTPEAHIAIADCLDDKIFIDLFIIGRRGMERSFQSFAIKFRSIKRNYKVLAGEDPIADLVISEDKLRFYCEQSLRNLRLRSVHQYIYNRNNRKAYLRYLLNVDTSVFTDITEIMRMENINIPANYTDRIPMIEKHFNLNAQVLKELLSIKENPKLIRNLDIKLFHKRLFNMFNSIILWIEKHWPAKE